MLKARTFATAVDRTVQQFDQGLIVESEAFAKIITNCIEYHKGLALVRGWVAPMHPHTATVLSIRSVAEQHGYTCALLSHTLVTNRLSFTTTAADVEDFVSELYDLELVDEDGDWTDA